MTMPGVGAPTGVAEREADRHRVADKHTAYYDVDGAATKKVCKDGHNTAQTKKNFLLRCSRNGVKEYINAKTKRAWFNGRLNCYCSHAANQSKKLLLAHCDPIINFSFAFRADESFHRQQ